MVKYYNKNRSKKSIDVNSEVNDPEKLLKKSEISAAKIVDKSDIPVKNNEEYESKYDVNSNNVLDLEESVIKYLEKELMEGIKNGLPSGEFADKLSKYENMYLMEPDPSKDNDPWPGASNTMHPGASIAIKGKHARWIKSIFGIEPYCLISPIGKAQENAESKDIISKLENWFQCIYSKVMRAENEHKMVFLNAGKLNTGIAMLSWETKYEKVYENNVEYTDLQQFISDFPTAKDAGVSERKYQEYIQQLSIMQERRIQMNAIPQGIGPAVPQMPEGVTVDQPEPNMVSPIAEPLAEPFQESVIIPKIEKCISVYNYPILKNVNRDKFVIIPNDIDNLDVAIGYGYEFDLTWNDLKKGEAEGIYYNIDRIVSNGGSNSGSNEGDSQAEISRKESEGKSDADIEKELKKTVFKAYKLIYKHDIDDDGLNEKLILTYISGYNVIIRAELWDENLYFIPHYIERRPGRFDGMGVCAKLETINDQGTIFWNLRANAARMICAPSFKGKKGSDFDPTREEWYPGVIFWLADMGDVEQWVLINNFPELYNEEAQLEKYAQLQTGLTSGHGGREMSSDPNAPGNKTIALIQEGNILIDEDISTLREGVELVFYFLFRMFAKHLPENDKYLQSFGLKKQDLVVALDQIALNGISVSQNPDARRINDTVFFQTFAREPIFSDPMVRNGLYRSVFSSWGRDKLALLPSDEEIKRMQVETMKQALMEMDQEKQMAQEQSSMGNIENNARRLPEPPPMPLKPTEIRR